MLYCRFYLSLRDLPGANKNSSDLEQLQSVGDLNDEVDTARAYRHERANTHTFLLVHRIFPQDLHESYYQFK
jgi:hypothetical protein